MWAIRGPLSRRLHWLFAALGLATLTAPFILAGWLIRAGIQMLGKAVVERAPCAHGENQPRLR